MVKIVITGPESTGKTTLCKALAEKFETTWVPEYAREYIDRLDRPYDQSDLLLIAEGQAEAESRAAESADGILFCDTNLLTIKIWSEYAYGFCDSRILALYDKQKCDYYLLTDIDLPWTADPQREHPNERDILFEKYRKEVEHSGVPFGVVSGSGEDRTAAAVKVLMKGNII